MIHLLLALRRTTTAILASVPVPAPLASAIKLDPISRPRDAVPLADTVAAFGAAGAQTARARTVARAAGQARHVARDIGVIVAVAVGIRLLGDVRVCELLFELREVVVDDVRGLAWFVGLGGPDLRGREGSTSTAGPVSTSPVGT